MDPAFWRGTNVFVTGHTGFKGAWLSLWLQALGARVTGLALPPVGGPDAVFSAARIGEGLASHEGDILDPDTVRDRLCAARPVVVFHLAAQAFVRRSYVDPVTTFATNVMGTIHVLEAARACPTVRAVVVVTSDKCYENKGWPWGYREVDDLGGHDPYSASKACAEVATAAWRSSFCEAADTPCVATVRSGNVVGGGDTADDRLVPDVLRALDAGATPEIRYPDATRPWQHVLEPLSGYLALASRLAEGDRSLARAFNFGPALEDVHPVRHLVTRLMQALGAPATWRSPDDEQPHEAHLLALDSSLARSLLGWRPTWTLDQAVDRVVAWHAGLRAGQDMRDLSLRQIHDFVESSEDR